MRIHFCAEGRAKSDEGTRIYVLEPLFFTGMARSNALYPRHVPVGAELVSNGAHFRVWAPEHTSIQVIFESGREAVRLIQEEDGAHFSGFAAEARSADRYKYLIDDAESFPDPASRYQPEGPCGFSQIVNPNSFPWSDDRWKGVELAGQIIYEIHLGTFTDGGNWRSAAEKLPYLRDTGITLIEVMPVAEFPGRFGWGYDGVQLYAPASIYGTPEDMRFFVNEAHRNGIGVILDVVYNHLGAEDNYLAKFSRFYFSKKECTDWGDGINFQGKCSGPVREFFRENAAYWIREFHLDGLRLDATQNIYDESEPHILAEITQTARRAAGGRSIVITGENEPQNTRLIRPIEGGGYGLDALWNDDYHHSATVALTGKADAYYTDYRGTPQEFLSAVKYGYLYQGQWYRWQKKPRGTSTFGLPQASMVTFIQNHDQVANSARGQRVQELSAPGVFRALTALTLLGPGTPMLFQGQEFGATTPFLFFADHKAEFAEKTRKGRLEFLSQWRSLCCHEMQSTIADPNSEDTFKRSRLDFTELERHPETYDLHKDLLRLRREDPVISRQGKDGIDGAVLSQNAFVIRFFSPGYMHDRLLMINLGVDLEWNPSPEPLLAPPFGTEWQILWSTDEPQYGGNGTPPLDTEWKIPGQAAVVLQPVTSKTAKIGNPKSA